MSDTAHTVRHLRQSLLWPLRLMPIRGAEGRQARPWEVLKGIESSPWHEVVDEYQSSSHGFHERHYNEFVTFLPFVQRFLYGEGRREGQQGSQGSPMRVFRRTDVKQVRVALHPGDAPLLIDVMHVDLYFFLDLDLVLLNVETAIHDLPLSQAQELMYRFGRGYPPGWDENGLAQHCLASVQWLGEAGVVLAESDAHQREAFLDHVSRHRAPRIAAHWDWMLRPLVSDHSDQPGALRYRQIEYYRMPVMAYLALDNPGSLSRADCVRLGLVTGAAAEGENLPFGEDHLADFEQRYCYDRFWKLSGSAPHTRYMCCGHSLVVVGDAGSRFFTSPERGVLAQFRHQHFLLFLIAHFQKASLLMFSDRLAEALEKLDISDADSVRRFKRTIRHVFAGFLRFTHRYWFHEVSEQAQAKALFNMMVKHLDSDPLYAEVKQRIADMSAYLETDSLRRQANTVVRLTVVTIFGLIGTITTGFLGMNLLAEAEAPLSKRVGLFVLVAFVATAVTFYTMVKSKRLSDFLDVLSDERATFWQKCLALGLVWKK